MRVALFYFVLYTSVGIILPYLPPYYRSLGFSGKEIALAVSLQPLLTIVVPPIWGYLADRTRRPVWLLHVATTGAALAFVPMLFADTVAAVVATLALFSVFSTPLGSLIDSVAVVEARRIGTDYARLRLWGSLGFVAASFCFGQWLAHGGGEAKDAVWWALTGIVGYAIVSRGVRPPPVEAGLEFAPPPSLNEAAQLLRRPAVVLFLVAAMVHWSALAPYHMLFALHLDALGASATAVGAGFAAAVAAEVVVMWRFRDLAKRLPLEPILLLAFASGTLRWLLTAVLDSGLPIAAVQVLHGLTYGAFFIGSIVWLDREIPERLRATGRALFAASVFGLGGVLGNALAGTLFDLGGARLAFLAGSGLDLVPIALILVATRLGRGATAADGAMAPQRS